MKTQRQAVLIIILYALIDAACVFLSFYLVLMLRPQAVPFSASVHGFFSSSNPFKILFLVWTPVTVFFHQVHGLYQTHREQLEGLEVLEVIRSTAVSTLVIIVLVYVLHIRDFPRSIMILNAFGIAFLCSLWRALKKQLVTYLAQHGYNNFNTVIIGAGKVGTLLAEEINKRPGLGINIVGFLDDHKTGTVGNGRWPVLGRIGDFSNVAQKSFISKVFITIYPNNDMFVRILEEARLLGMAVRVVPQGYEWMSQAPLKYNVGIIPVLEYSDISINYHLRFKRLFDFTLTCAALVFLLPVYAVLAVLIRMDSPGPAFYSSRRYGCKGKVFHMYKFRSMVCNADDMLACLKEKNEVDGPIFKIRKDPRVTRLGAFLRKYSLDELPQLFNVLKGDMSLVGPRPLPVDQIEKEDLQQLKRLEVRPGITGLWQVRGRSDLPFVRLVKWDTWYINNWSFGLDLYILLQTLPVVLRGKGAY